MGRTFKQRVRGNGARKTLKGGLYIGVPGAGGPRDNLTIPNYQLIMQRHLAGDIGHDAIRDKQSILQRYAAIYGGNPVLTNVDLVNVFRISQTLDEKTLLNRLVKSDDFRWAIDELDLRKGKRMVFTSNKETAYFDGKSGIKLFNDCENLDCAIVHDAGRNITGALGATNLISPGSCLDQAGKPNGNREQPRFFVPAPANLPIEIDLREYGFGAIAGPSFVDRLVITGFTGDTVSCQFGGTLTLNPGGIVPNSSGPNAAGIRYIDAITMAVPVAAGGRKPLNMTDIARCGFFTSNGEIAAIEAAGGTPDIQKILFTVGKALGDTSLVIFSSPQLRVFQQGTYNVNIIQNPFLAGNLHNLNTRAQTIANHVFQKCLLKTHDYMNYLRAIIKGVHCVMQTGENEFEFFPGYSGEPPVPPTALETFILENANWVILIDKHKTEVDTSYHNLINYFGNYVLPRIRNNSLTETSFYQNPILGAGPNIVAAENIVRFVITALAELKRQNVDTYTNLVNDIEKSVIPQIRQIIQTLVAPTFTYTSILRAGQAPPPALPPPITMQNVTAAIGPVPVPVPVPGPNPVFWSQSNEIKLNADFNNRKANKPPATPNANASYLSGPKVPISKHHSKFSASLAMPLKALNRANETDLFVNFLGVLYPALGPRLTAAGLGNLHAAIAGALADAAPGGALNAVQLVTPLLGLQNPGQPAPPLPGLDMLGLQPMPAVLPLDDHNNFITNIPLPILHTGITTVPEAGLVVGIVIPTGAADVVAALAPAPAPVAATPAIPDLTVKTSNMLFKEFQEYFGFTAKRAVYVVVDAFHRLTLNTASFFSDITILKRLYTEATGIDMNAIGPLPPALGGIMHGGSYTDPNTGIVVPTDTIYAINEFACWINENTSKDYGFCNGHVFVASPNQQPRAIPPGVVPMVPEAITCNPALVIPQVLPVSYITYMSRSFNREREYYCRSLRASCVGSGSPDVFIGIEINNEGEINDPTFQRTDNSRRFFQYTNLGAIQARDILVDNEWTRVLNGPPGVLFIDPAVSNLAQLPQTHHSMAFLGPPPVAPPLIPPIQPPMLAGPPIDPLDDDNPPGPKKSPPRGPKELRVDVAKSGVKTLRRKSIGLTGKRSEESTRKRLLSEIRQRGRPVDMDMVDEPERLDPDPEFQYGNEDAGMITEGGGQRVSPEKRTIDATKSGVRLGGSGNTDPK